eukprot:Skav231562  [mRNA]  locus=scaffold481:123334:137959:- [translate_table: standard]
MLGRPLFFMGSEIGEPWCCSNAVDWDAAALDPQKMQPETVVINFEVRHEETTHGDSLRVVGDCPELGNWQPTEGAKLRTSSKAFPFWRLGITCRRVFRGIAHMGADLLQPQMLSRTFASLRPLAPTDLLDGKFGDNVDASVYERVEMFHTDSVMCGISALALKTNAPTILREEALTYSDAKGATVFGSSAKCAPEKVIAANASAALCEFGHNDFYPVVMAAAQACAIASAAVYGALLGASVEQRPVGAIESAIGMAVAHYIPFRAIRKQLSDSKGASAAISTEAAVLSVRRNKVRWGPGPSPFNLILSHSGDDFAMLVGGVDGIAGINIIAYEPAFGIIGDPAKKDPKTRQSADHSMAFIVSRILQKALKTGKVPGSMDEAWMELMLSPYDYGKDALYEKDTRALMEKISFSHGGPEYDAKYPDGIPTAIDITLKSGKANPWDGDDC